MALGLQSYDFLVSHVDAKGKASSALAAGAHAYAIPLTQCWTKTRAARECWPVAKVLMEALARNPESSILKADSTWICLHLAFEKQTGAPKKSARATFLSNIPEGLQEFPCKRDFDTLALELGQEVQDSLRLTYDVYMWARSVLDAYGLIFMGDGGDKVEALVPGVELFKKASDSEVSASPSDVRLETSDGNFSEPTVVVYAKKNYAPGDDLSWYSMRQFKARGVPFVVKFPYRDCGKHVMDNLCSLLGGSPSSKIGDSCAAEDDSPVEVVMEEGKALVKVTLRLTEDKPLPGKDVMSLIGCGILADPEVLQKCMDDEAATPGVMQEDQCDKRALRFLRPELLKLMRNEDETVEAGEMRYILSITLPALNSRIDAAWEPKGAVANKSMKQLLAVSPETAMTVEWPAGTDKAVEVLKASTKELKAMGNKPEMMKIQVMQTCLKSTIFGDPAAVPLASVASENQTVEVFREAAQAELSALAQCHEAESKTSNKAQALCKKGNVEARSNRFKEALTSFQQSIQASPSTTAMTMAIDCAQVVCAYEAQFSANADCKLALDQLRKFLKQQGYAKAGVPTPRRFPASLPVALASLQTGPDSVLTQALSVSSEVSDVVELVRFFMLRRSMPVKKVRLLLGAKNCNALLEHSILTCFDPNTCTKLAPAAAQKVVSEPKSRGSHVIFSNVALQAMGDLLVVSDFDYGFMIPGTFEPEPYVAQDTAALAASFDAIKESKVESPGSKTLVDSIPAGLAAAARGGKVYFAGSKRFQEFAELSCALNGFQDCKFTDKFAEGYGTFDIVLFSVARLPNPDMVIGMKGPMFKDGMRDTWATSLEVGLALLNPKGILVQTCSFVNSCKSTCEKLMGGSHQAAIFTSKPSKAQDLLMNLSTGCAAVHHFAYMMGLQKAGVTTTSEAVILAWNSPAGKDKTVEMMQERSGLYADTASLRSVVQSAYNSFVQSVAVQQIVSSEPGGSLYDLDWDEDTGSTSASDKEAVPRSNPWETTQSNKAVQRKMKAQERNEQTNGALWKDVINANVMGWAPPINLYSTWRISPYPQKVGQMPADFPAVCVVELPHINIPSDFMDAMRDTFDCKTKFSFSGESKKFTPVTAGRSSRRRRRSAEGDDASMPIDAYPIIIVPIPPGSYEDKEIVDLPLMMIYFSQYFADKVRDGAQLLILTLTCNAFGPTMNDHIDTVSRAGALTGLTRTLRLEVKGLNMWNVDCDNFMATGDSMEVMAQLSLELNCPDHNFEIVWRNGKRWIRSFELSSRNPINGPAIGPAFPWLEDEPNGCVIITGGTGGLGVVSAEALIEAGCKRVVLSSRSGKVTAVGQGLEERIEKMNALPGVQLILEKCDTSSEQQVIDALERTRKNVGPIKVIIHAAGVLADTILDFQNEQTMKKSFQPKADGAWFLHNHTLEDDLTGFVCFSSVSSLHGNPGQANYSSSNAYMDTLCRMRTHHGLPGIALMWPAVAEVGMAASGILANVAFDEVTQVKPDTVKTVMRHCCCRQYPLEPLIAVCPLGCFWPNSPNMALLTEPLFTKYRDEKVYKQAVKLAENDEQYKGTIQSTQGKVNPTAAH